MCLIDSNSITEFVYLLNFLIPLLILDPVLHEQSSTPIEVFFWISISAIIFEIPNSLLMLAVACLCSIPFHLGIKCAKQDCNV